MDLRVLYLEISLSNMSVGKVAMRWVCDKTGNACRSADARRSADTEGCRGPQGFGGGDQGVEERGGFQSPHTKSDAMTQLPGPGLGGADKNRVRFSAGRSRLRGSPEKFDTKPTGGCAFSGSSNAVRWSNLHILRVETLSGSTVIYIQLLSKEIKV